MNPANQLTGRFVVKVSTLSFIAVLFMAVSIYFTGADSLGTLELGIALITFLVCFKKCRMINAMPMLFLTGVVLVLLYFSGKMGVTGFNAPIKHALKFVHLLFAFVCYLLFEFALDEKYKRLFIYVILTASAVSCLRSIYMVFTGNDYAIRYASRYGYYGNVAGFSQVYGIPFLLIIVLSCLLDGQKKTKLQRLYLIAVLAIYICFIYVSLFATALILSVSGILAYLLIKLVRKNLSNAIVVLSALVFATFLILLVFPNQIMNLVNRMTSGLNYVLQSRIRYVFQSVLNVSASISYTHGRREELANYSLNTFKEYPVFGAGYSRYGYGVIGCHQEWPDLLGVFGLVGAVIVWAVIIYMLRNVYSGMVNQNEQDMFRVLTIMFVVLGFLNPCLGAPMLLAIFVIAPNSRYLYRKEMELLI